jgi:hypothetical protein
VIKHEFTTGLLLTSAQKALPLKPAEITTDTSTAVPRVTVTCSFPLETTGMPVQLTSKLLASVDPLHRIALRIVGIDRTESRVLHSFARTVALK